MSLRSWFDLQAAHWGYNVQEWPFPHRHPRPRGCHRARRPRRKNTPLLQAIHEPSGEGDLEGSISTLWSHANTFCPPIKLALAKYRKIYSKDIPLRLMPFSPIAVSSPLGSISRSCSNEQARMTSQNLWNIFRTIRPKKRGCAYFWSSSSWPKRMFSRRVALRIHALWGT